MSWDKNWEKIFNQNEWGKYPSIALARFMAKNFYKFRDRKKIRILEVGCGPGANLWYLAREGFSVYGVDGSASALKIARQRLNNECQGWIGELLQGDIVSLPFQDDYFDAVLDLEAISTNSYADARKIYHEIWRVCKTGGRLFSVTFASGSYGDGLGKRVTENEWYVSHGPLAKDVLVRFTPFESVKDLIAPWQIVLINENSYTTDGAEKHKYIRELLIEGIKK